MKSVHFIFHKMNGFFLIIFLIITDITYGNENKKTVEMNKKQLDFA